MNFVIFPMFFLSSALYPLWKIRESNPLLARIAEWNPFTYAVESIRFALYGQVNMEAFVVAGGALLVFLGGAIWGYDPTRGILHRKSR